MNGNGKRKFTYYFGQRTHKNGFGQYLAQMSVRNKKKHSQYFSHFPYQIKKLEKTMRIDIDLSKLLFFDSKNSLMSETDQIPPIAANQISQLLFYICCQCQ